MNGIDLSKLRNLTVREIMQALGKDGFYFDRGTGSHHFFRHPDGRKVMISFHHQGDTFKRKTLKGIIQDAGWTEFDLRRLKLLK